MRAYNISSAVNKLLGFQAVFQSSIKYPSYFRAMSSSPATNVDANRIINYWFTGSEPLKKWFTPNSTTDEEIRDQFSDLVGKARASQLNSWKVEPTSTLALIILLDQFPRNLYRGSHLSYSSDVMAREIAVEAIAKGFDREVDFLKQPFFYMPLMHDESLLGQIAALGMFESFAARCSSDPDAVAFMEDSLKATRAHLKCIARFGRFPARNEPLGRVPTEEEVEFLKKNPHGFEF